MELKDLLEKLNIIDETTRLYFENYTTERLLSRIKNNSNAVIIFGAGSAGQFVLNFLEKNNIKVNCFVDSDAKKWGKTINGYKVKSPEFLTKNDLVLIASMWQKDIISTLKMRGISNYICNLLDFYKDVRFVAFDFDLKELSANIDLLYNFYLLLEDNESKDIFSSLILYLMENPSKIKESFFSEYFHPLIKPENNDVIVDAGAYTGDTIEEIINKNIQYNKIYAFEPDEKNYEKLLQNTKKHNNIKCIRAGLWDKSKRLFFYSDGIMGSFITQNQKEANSFIDVMSLDEFFKDKEPTTLIKMDIEGAEYEALLGAKDTITKYKPKLQICIYHKLKHLWQIPLLIKELVPEYKLYLGHHAQFWGGTVLYARV